MNLEDLGWSEELERAFDAQRQQSALNTLVAGRVTRQERGTYFVETAEGALLARVPGRMRHRASDPLDLPAVGDWLAVDSASDPARIHAVLPRKSVLVRKAIEDASGELQVIAANVDVVLVVEGLDREARPRRVERIVALARDAGATPLVLLNKADVPGAEEKAQAITAALAGGAEVLAISAKHGAGVAEVNAHLARAQTAILVGASGAGKSTLANALLGQARQATTEVREGDAKGRHTTTNREMFVLPSGALLIDGPGMREFGLWLAEGDVAETFPDISELGQGCRFRDCTHAHEPGCAVLAAADAGTLPRDRLESFHKLSKEHAFRVAQADPLSAQERKARAKQLTSKALKRSLSKRR